MKQSIINSFVNRNTNNTNELKLNDHFKVSCAIVRHSKSIDETLINMQIDNSLDSPLTFA